jgi:hypothetical protein
MNQSWINEVMDDERFEGSCYEELWTAAYVCLYLNFSLVQ